MLEKKTPCKSVHGSKCSTAFAAEGQWMTCFSLYPLSLRNSVENAVFLTMKGELSRWASTSELVATPAPWPVSSTLT